jgi:hypothetical protein
VKLLKLLTVPAVLLISLLMAVPASAHHLRKATVSVGCGTGANAGKVCVTLTGDIEQDNAERFVFFDVFASGSNTSLGEIKFDLPAFDSKPGANNHFSQTICFPAITNSNASSFTVNVVKVTSDVQGLSPSDLVIELPSGDVTFDARHQPSTPVGDTDKCVVTSTSPSPSPSVPASSSPSTSPSANTTVALAATGGFDFRFPLIGLTVLVAGLALFLVSASRGRRSTGDK